MEGIFSSELRNAVFCLCVGFFCCWALTKFQKVDETKKSQKSSHADLTQSIFDASFDSIFCINEKGIIEMVNNTAVRTFGWTEEEFIGNNIRIIVGEKHAKNHDFYLAKHLAKTSSKKIVGKLRELEAIRKDGSTFPIELGLAEVKLEGSSKRVYTGFVKDITRQKENEAKLLKRENLTRGIMDASFDPMVSIDQQGVMQLVNNATVKEFGWTKEELVGQNVSMMMGKEHASKHDEYLKRFMETGNKKVMGKQRELEAKRKDGTVFPISLGLVEIQNHENHDENRPVDGAKDGVNTSKNEDNRSFVAFIHNLTEQKKMLKIECEKASTEALLLNMLPSGIANRLKQNPTQIADSFPNATILFADIVGFTFLTSFMNPIEVVSMLNDLFSMFDNLVDKYRLNKVKTIGDCYMVTSVPASKQDDYGCSRVCNFALDMIDCLMEYNKVHRRQLDLRIGVNLGPVVAGIVGTKRFLYDVWGDSVNLASRMESTGISGKIQVTGAVVAEVSEEFDFETRGLIKIKGKGEMETYILKKRRVMDSLSDIFPISRFPRARNRYSI